MMKSEELTLTQEWDKTFPKNEKVTFRNHFGITLSADLYEPKNAAGKLPAIAVCGPFGACKEQSSGLYAQTRAERGFLTVAFDPSFTGESGGYARLGGVVDPLPEDAPYFVKDYHDYYKTPRGYHPRSLNSNDGWTVNTGTSLMNMRLFTYSKEIRSAVLMIHGDKAHSCYMSRDAYADMVKDSKYAGNKELHLIPGASHTDLYDQVNIIPFDKLESFFSEYLK